MSELNHIFEVVFESFDPDTDLQTDLKDLNFDSMAQILLIGELEDRYGVIIDAESFQDLTTLDDLSNFIKSYIKYCD